MTTSDRIITAAHALLTCADNLIGAIEGTTDQFEDEICRLSAAATAVEKALPPITVAGLWRLTCPSCAYSGRIRPPIPVQAGH